MNKNNKVKRVESPNSILEQQTGEGIKKLFPIKRMEKKIKNSMITTYKLFHFKIKIHNTRTLL